jgi:hypothetical protein
MDKGLTSLDPKTPARGSIRVIGVHSRVAPELQKFAQLQLQLRPFFAPGCTQLHLIAEKHHEIKNFLINRKNCNSPSAEDSES